jgi:hypothetical protein
MIVNPKPKSLLQMNHKEEKFEHLRLKDILLDINTVENFMMSLYLCIAIYCGLYEMYATKVLFIV